MGILRTFEGGETTTAFGCGPVAQRHRLIPASDLAPTRDDGVGLEGSVAEWTPRGVGRSRPHLHPDHLYVAGPSILSNRLTEIANRHLPCLQGGEQHRRALRGGRHPRWLTLSKKARVGSRRSGHESDGEDSQVPEILAGGLP